MSRAIQDDGLDQEAAVKVPPLPGFFLLPFFYLRKEKECMKVLDFWMALTLIAAFALVVGFVVWCDRSIGETGGERA